MLSVIIMPGTSSISAPMAVASAYRITPKWVRVWHTAPMKNAAVMVWKKALTFNRISIRRKAPVKTPQTPARRPSGRVPPKNTGIT